MAFPEPDALFRVEAFSMLRRVFPLFSVFAALAVLAAAPVVQAQNCSTKPADVSGDWEVADGTRLCSGTYEVRSMNLRGNRTLFVGGANDDGQVVIRVAQSATIAGTVNGTGGGLPGGAGCTTALLAPNPGGAGSDGKGPAPGGGKGAAAFSGNEGGGAGGGGAGYGNNGGSGGTGSGRGTGGAGGGPYGSATDHSAGPGAGGGGGSCSRTNALWGAFSESGHAGGAGGASFSLQAKAIYVGTDAIVRLDGETGGAGSNAGGPGGGGAGGSVMLHATEQLFVGGQLQARGGQGGNGFSNRQGASGGGGGGSGGRIQIFGPSPCARFETVVRGGVAGTAGAQAASKGMDGATGTVHCANIQAPPVASLTASPAFVAQDETLTLTADATDPNGHLLKYEFDCGDGVWTAASTSPTSSCTYPSLGSFTARVRVTDWNSIALVSGTTTVPPGTYAFGGSTVATTEVTVSNGEPVISLVADPDPASEGDTVSFKVDILDSPGDMAAGFEVTWDFGDGEAPVTDTGVQSPASRTYTYPESGDRTVTVTVKDRNGAQATASLKLDVRNVAPTVKFISAPSQVSLGESASFTVETSDPSPGDMNAGFTYVFNWDEPAVTDTYTGGATFTANKTFSQVGIHRVSVTAKDRDGAVSEPAFVIVTVVDSSDPLPPGDFVFVTEPANATIDEGSRLKVTASWRDPLPTNHDSPFEFIWNFGDGSPEEKGFTTPGTELCGSGVCTTTITVDHTYENSGNFVLQLTVKNVLGQAGSASLTVTVRNVPPIASIIGAPSGDEGSPVEFKFSASDVSEADTKAGFTWTVSWGDGSPNTTLVGVSPVSTSHVFDDNGDYQVTLTVIDQDGGASLPAQVTVPIANVAPTVELSIPAAGEEGSSLSFSAVVTDPSSADTAHGFDFTWDFGDGSPPVVGRNLNRVEHTYVDDGTYTVSLTVKDKDGGATTETATMVVANVPPTVFLGSDLELRRGEVFSIAASATDPGANDTLTYEWSFGDGTSATGPTVSHSYSEFGEYTITVVVRDGDGGEASDSIVARVRNAPPIASNVVIEPVEPVAGDALSLSWTYSDPDGDPENGTTVRWTIDGEPAPRFDDLDVIEGTATMRGQVWRATVTPKDGTDFGLPVQSPPVTIGNEAPVATDVAITPAEPRAADALKVSYVYFDADGDRESGTLIRWTRNGASEPSRDGSRTVNPPLVKGDVWQVTVTPNDGALPGEPITSEPVTVLNTPPTVLRFDDIAVPAEDELTLVSFDITAFDVDDDPLDYYCELDGERVSEGSQVELRLPEGIHEVFCTVSDGTDATTESLHIAVGDVGPLVDAGPDRTVNPDEITLTAVGRDPLRQPLSYSWRVASAPADTTLDTPELSSTTLVVRTAGEYVFEVTVSNGTRTATDKVTITVRNIAPVANAGPPVRTGRAGEPLALDARASTDANGDELSYSWEFVSGPEAEFEGATTGELVVVVPATSGELVVKLTVSDGTLSSSTTVSIRVSPKDGPGTNPPVAVAGEDQTAIVGETVTLDGSGSYDVDGDVLTYDWSQRGGPTLELEDSEEATTTFVPAVPGTYSFVLTVFDGSFFSYDTVTVEVFDGAGNTRPVAVITPEETSTAVVERVTLDGSQSHDAEGSPLTYRWEQLSGPTANLIGATTSSVRVNSMSPGVVVLSLVVNDGQLDSRPALAKVFVTDGSARPVAVAKGPAFALLGASHELDGSESHDPQGALLTYQWTQVEGTFLALERPGTVNPTFTPTAAGTYVFQLVVNNGLFDSEPDTIEIEVGNNRPPLAVIEGPVETFVGESIHLTGQRSVDPDGDELTFAWSIVSGGDGASLLGADTTQPTFVASVAGVYEVGLVVSDGRFDSAEVRHRIVVAPLPTLQGGCDCGAGAGLSGLALVGLAALLRRRRKAGGEFS